MIESNVPTEEVGYPCPKCGRYYTPYMHTRDGYALMICEEHGQYKTSVRVSANFRKFCSKIARKPNRSQSYYTSTEALVRKVLEDNGYRQGRDFFHNIMIEKDKRSKYYVDFLLPSENLIIEVDPSVWHNMWNRNSSDSKKYSYLESLGYTVVSVNEKNYKELGRILQKNVV